MPTTTDHLETSYSVVNSLPQPASTAIPRAIYDGCWASSGTLEFAVEDDRLAANPINRRDPSGLSPMIGLTPGSLSGLVNSPQPAVSGPIITMDPQAPVNPVAQGSINNIQIPLSGYGSNGPLGGFMAGFGSAGYLSQEMNPMLSLDDRYGEATVYYWHELAHGNWGHVSMEFQGGGFSGYVSFGPCKSRPWAVPSNYYSYDDDVQEEGRPPDEKVTIDGVNALKMAAEWEVAKSLYFEILGWNCAAAVAKVLYAGLDTTYPTDVPPGYIVDTFWTSGPGEVPGLDRPGNMFHLAVQQSHAGGSVYWATNPAWYQP